MQRQRGATLVEAAVVFLLLFTLTMAIFEFGRVLNMYQTMTNAAREGARFGTAPCQSGVAGQSCSYGGYPYQPGQLPSEHSVVVFVDRFLDADGMTGYVVNVNWDRDDYLLTADEETIPATYRHVSVDITANYRWIFFPLPELPLHTRAVMKHELELE